MTSHPSEPPKSNGNSGRGSGLQRFWISAGLAAILAAATVMLVLRRSAPVPDTAPPPGRAAPPAPSSAASPRPLVPAAAPSRPVETEGALPPEAQLPKSAQHHHKATPPPPLPPGPIATPGPMPMPTAAPDPADEAQRLLDSMHAGQMAFNAPAALKLHQSSAVRLVISPSQTAEELKALVAGPGQMQTGSLKISSVMHAQLSGPGFEIKAVTPEEQLLSQTEPTQWMWDLRPLEPGTQHLHLAIDAVVKLDGQERRRNLRTFDREIAVQVENSAGPYVLGAGAALLVGASFWGLRKLRRRSRHASFSRPLESGPCDLFVSYCRQDGDRIFPLLERLKAQGISTWVDLSGIHASTHWQTEIVTALRAAKAVLFFVSPAAFASRFVLKEITLAFEEGKVIIPVYLEPAEIPDAFRLPLTGLQHVQLRIEGEEQAVRSILAALEKK